MSDANLRFPKDEASVGGFTTRLKFESWTNSNVNKDKSESAGEVIKPDHVFDIWLPMPNELSTGYTGSFEENDNMSISESRSGGMAGVAKGRAAGLAKGGSLEIAGLLNTVLAPNASAKMSSRSILNNNMGVSFNGINLREHTFSWNLTPKSKSEQNDILEIIKQIDINIKFFQPVTSNMFGISESEVQNELTFFNPQSPYGIAKTTAFFITKFYRETYYRKI
jgi:hypothetical protein